MRVSFDFDGTLESKYIQDYARKLIERGIEVWVVTSRFGDDEKYKRFYHTSINVDLTNKDLREITNELGIPEARLVFTNMADKYEFFEKNQDFLWHIDDDWIENDLINKNTKVEGINIFGNSSWMKKTDEIINKELTK